MCSSQLISRCRKRPKMRSGTSGYNGAAIILEPKSGEVMTFVECAGVRSELVRERHRSSHLAPVEHRQASSSAKSRDPRALLTRVDLQAGGRHGGAREWYRDTRFQGALQRRCGVLRPLLQVPPCRRTGTVDMRHAIETWKRDFYTLGNMLGVDRHSRVGGKARHGGQNRDRFAQRSRQHRALDRLEETKDRRERYAGETISVAIGQGQNSITPTSMAVMMATLANGGTRVVPHLVKAIDEGQGVAGPCRRRRAHSNRSSSRTGTIAAIHDGLWMAVNQAGTAGDAPAFRAVTSRAKQVLPR